MPTGLQHECKAIGVWSHLSRQRCFASEVGVVLDELELGLITGTIHNGLHSRGYLYGK